MVFRPEGLNRFTKQDYVKTLSSPVHFHRKILGNPFELSKPQVDALTAVAVYPETLVIAGAKGGKSTLSSDVALWMCYRLLCMPNPIKHYHLNVGTNMYVMNIAPQQDLALNIVLAYIRGFAEGSWFLSRLIETPKKNELRFIDNIVCRAQGSSSNAGLGYAIFGLVMDEICHFMDTKGRMSGYACYNNYTPRLLPFGTDGRLFAISTPAGRQGVGYDMFATGVPQLPYLKQPLPTHGEYPYRAVFQLATWEMNPLFSRTHPFLLQQYKRDPFFFRMEFGGEFADVVAAFFNLRQLEMCKEARPLPNRDKSHRYVVTHDPSMYHDAYGVIMGHLQEDGKIRVDLAKAFRPNIEKEIPVKVADVEEYILDLCERYNVVDIIGDETRTAPLITSLADKGKPSRGLRYGAKSDIRLYQPLLEVVNMQMISIVPDEELFQELRFLERVQLVDRYRVQASPGNTDDLADCVAMLTYVLRVEGLAGGVFLF